MRTRVNLVLAAAATTIAFGGGGDAAQGATIASQRHTAVLAEPGAVVGSGHGAKSGRRHGAARPRLRAAQAFAALAAAPNGGPAPSITASAPGLGPTSGLPYPPDQFGAIGPEHYVQGVTNTGVAVFSRGNLGKVAGPVAAGTFSAAPAQADVVDTQMMWDAQTSRWYYAFTYKRWQNGNRTAGLLYGWSKTADPTDLARGWCRMRIDNGADFDDRPKLGDNLTHLIIATNADPWSGDDYDRVWTMPKPSTGDTSCPASQSGIKTFGSTGNPLKTSDGNIVDSAIVAQDNDGAPNGWVVAADDRAAADDEIMLWHVNSGGDLVADGNIAVSPYSAPPAAPQPSPNQPLDPVDQRLNSAIADVDPDAGTTAVWTSHTIADPSGSGRSIVRWYEIVPSACVPVKGVCSSDARRQQGEVKDPSNSLFNAAMAPTDAGNEAVLHYDSAGTSQLVQVRARSRGPNTRLGTLGDEVVVDTSDAAYDEPTCHDSRPYCRWGDYSAATTDPTDRHAVWGSNQAIGRADAGRPHWKTRNFAIRPGVSPSPPPPDTGPPGDPPGNGGGDGGGSTGPPTTPPGPTEPAVEPKNRRNTITVMSRDLGPAAAPDDRMKLVALEIARSNPHLVGLQKVVRSWPVDYVAALCAELKRLGASYRVVAVRGVPAGNVVLAREGVRVRNVRSSRIANQLDATVGRQSIHFVNAHLDGVLRGDRVRQARQLVRGALKPRRLPTVLVGDLHSGPNLARTADRAPYRTIAAAGFWEARAPHFTCCFDGDLTGGLWNRSFDHIMARTRFAVVRSFVTGFAARTPGGLAASDHGGVVSVLRPKR
jgi:endonuclease/exonuclease/phosphatase family metal-dependent hydrolase